MTERTTTKRINGKEVKIKTRRAEHNVLNSEEPSRSFRPAKADRKTAKGFYDSRPNELEN